MTTRLYVIGILCIGAVAGFSLDLTVELTGHPWWFLLMMLICALSPGPVAFAVAIDGTSRIDFGRHHNCGDKSTRLRLRATNAAGNRKFYSIWI